jgi:hypothetical protein
MPELDHLFMWMIAPRIFLLGVCAWLYLRSVAR